MGKFVLFLSTVGIGMQALGGFAADNVPTIPAPEILRAENQ